MPQSAVEPALLNAVEMDRARFIYVEATVEFLRAYSEKWKHKPAEFGRLLDHLGASKSRYQALHTSYLAAMQSVDLKQSEDEGSDSFQTRLVELTDALSAADRAATEYSSVASENFRLISRYYLTADEPSSSREWTEKEVGKFVETEISLPLLYEQFDRQRTRYHRIFEAFKRDFMA